MKIQLLHHNARLPQRASEGAAGFDLFACEHGVLIPGARGLIPTGVAIELDLGWYARVAPRSGLAVNYGIAVNAGVIDQDYRGEIRVAAINHGDRVWEWAAGDRIAQLVLEWHYRGELVAVDQLSETQRGAGAMGSTGR